MSFGDAVRRLRLERGWKQAELARRSGITQGMISNLEVGAKSNPTQETIERLARAFGITTADLLREVDGPPVDALTEEGIPPSEITVLIQAWAQLTPEDRETALAVLRSMAARRHAKDQKPTQNHKPQTHPATG